MVGRTGQIIILGAVALFGIAFTIPTGLTSLGATAGAVILIIGILVKSVIS